MRLNRVAVLAALSVVLAVAASAGAEGDRARPPVRRIDRMRVVGTPVLDRSTSPGIYVWLEDGWFQLAAVTDLPFGTKKRRTRTYRVRISSTKPIQEKLGNFQRRGGKGDKELELEVVVGANPERAQVRTDGEITVSHAVVDGADLAVYVGPAAKPAAPEVRIGRY